MSHLIGLPRVRNNRQQTQFIIKPITMLPPVKPDSILRRRYRILEVVGQGGMGSIYRAEDRRLVGRICALKEIQVDAHLSPAQQAQARDQFHREASVLARLDHPNLPRVSDYFSENNRDYLVMDFVPGDDLRQRIEFARSRGELASERDILDWAGQLCDALSYLHNQSPPVLHRDIKPANIKLTPDGIIKLVDFGLVKVMTPDEERTITVLQGRGTAFYIPLEQYGGDTGHTDIRSDIYSLGATLYHIATGEPPAEAKSRFLNSESLTPPRQTNHQLSLRMEQAILWAMAMHPDERPPNIAAFRDLLLSTGPLNFWPTVSGQKPFARVAPVNRILALIAGALLVIAFVVTLLASQSAP